MSFVVGTRVRMSVEFADTEDGGPFDPQTVELRMDCPGLAPLIFTGGQISHESAGRYYVECLLPAAGACKYKWSSTAVGEEVSIGGSMLVVELTYP